MSDAREARWNAEDAADRKINEARDDKDAAVQAVIDAERAFDRRAGWDMADISPVLEAATDLSEADQALTAALAERKELP